MAETDTAQAGSREPDNQDASRRMSPETREKVARFEDKLYQQALQEQRDALPDTSIHAGGGTAMDRVDSYYPKHDVPIYSSGLNKQIDRVDMEIEKARRERSEGFLDPDADLYMKQLRREVSEDKHKTPEQREAERLAKHKRDSRFIYQVPVAVLIIAAIFLVLMQAFGA